MVLYGAGMNSNRVKKERSTHLIPLELNLYAGSPLSHAASSTVMMMQEQVCMPLSLLPFTPLPFLTSLFPLSTTPPFTYTHTHP